MRNRLKVLVLSLSSFIFEAQAGCKLILEETITDSAKLIKTKDYFADLFLNPHSIDITPLSFDEYIEFMENKLNMDDALRELRHRIPYGEFIHYPISS